MSSTDAEFMQVLLDAAQRHGRESEPDMEVGDLQVLAHQCWINMTPEQRQKVVEHFSTQDLLESWGPSPQ